jgi:hypothetical protein
VRPAAVLTAYAATLVVVFGAAAGVGAAVGPGRDGAEPTAMAGHASRRTAAHRDEGHGEERAHGEPVDVTATGLGIAEDGYVLRPERRCSNQRLARPSAS